MKLLVKVKANSKQEKIEEAADKEYVVWVRPPAKENKANLAVIELLSSYFSVPKSRINIIKGSTSKNKLIEII